MNNMTECKFKVGDKVYRFKKFDKSRKATSGAQLTVNNIEYDEFTKQWYLSFIESEDFYEGCECEWLNTNYKLVK